MVASATRRRLLRLARVLAMVFVVFHLAAGWYFATLIRADALQVKPFDDEVVTIVAVGEGLVTLGGGDEPPGDLFTDQTLGLDFGRGYGQIGEITDEKDGAVTRTYTHLSGEGPEIGLDATLHGVAFPRIPGVGGLPVWSDVTYEAPFGSFPAWLVDLHSPTWAITVHGRGAHRDEALRMLPSLTRAGLSTLMISYRNDSDAPATADRLARFGSTEWEDLEAAVQYALAHGAEDVVLVGFSMGGAISLAFMERSPLAEHVVGLILEAPALDLSGMVSARAADTDVIPGIPWKVPVTLTVAARAWADVLYDVNWWAIDYLGRATDLHRPILLIHGEDDGTVPVEQSIAFAARVGSAPTLEVFPGADHVRSWNVDAARHRAAVTRFLDIVLATSSA